MNMFLLAQVPPSAIVIGGGAVFVLVAIGAIVAKLIVVGNPSEMLVISGKRQREGQGYRVLIGGRTLVIPIIEKVSKLSLRNMQVGLEVSAQAGGGTMMPITITGVANVKVSSSPGERANAIERVLGQSSQALQRVARETPERASRAVVGKMTPYQHREHRHQTGP